MLHRPTSVPLPRQRVSPAGLATTGVLHIALVWLLLQYAPVQQAVRYVIYQAVRPASPPPPTSSASISHAITLPATPGTPGDPLSVFTLRPESSIPLQTTDTLPELQPRPPARTAPAPQNGRSPRRRRRACAANRS